MSYGSGLRHADAAALVRLLGQVIEHPGGLSARKRCFMQGLAQLLKADAWYWTYIQLIDPSPGGGTPYEVIHDGFTEEQIALYAVSREDRRNPPPEIAPLRQRFLENNAQPFTVRRQDIIDDDLWYNSPYCQRYLQRIGFDHPLYGHWPCPDHDRISVLTFFRHVGAPPFSPRQRAIVHTVTTESPWLHADRLPDQPPADLTQLAPRLRTTLLLLLEGLSEKQIARRLHLSPHTVHDYIKAIYRHFDVNNRPELFRRFTADTHLLPAPHA